MDAFLIHASMQLNVSMKTLILDVSVGTDTLEDVARLVSRCWFDVYFTLRWSVIKNVGWSKLWQVF